MTLETDCAIVVGGGAVGIHLAVQLVRRGRQVVMLESGDRSLGSFPTESFAVVGRRHDGIRIGRSRALGGTSNLWGGQLVEFMPVDFDGREWLKGSRWPVRFEELVPYYAETYQSLGIDDRLQSDEPVWAGIGKSRPSLGDEIEVFLTRWLKIPNIAAAFAREIDSNPRLMVVMGATAVGFEGDGRRIGGVVVVDDRGDRHLVRGSDVVLAAGTIENARLLMHAAADPSWQCPWQMNDNVGRYFQDHLGGRIAYIHPRNARAFYDIFCNMVHRGNKFQPKVRLTNDVLENEPLLNCQGQISFESSIRENLVFLKQFVKAALYRRKIGSLGEFVRNGFACARHMIPLMWKFVVEHRILIPSGSRITLFIQAETEPLRDSRILIDGSVRDSAGLPKVRLDWRLGQHELGSIFEFAHRIDRVLKDAGLADLQLEPELAAADPRFLDSLRDTNHQAGGCVMGESAADGVVDRDLKVFGTDNLFIAGACVFKTCSNANTTFTAMAFATRLAKHLGKGHATN